MQVSKFVQGTPGFTFSVERLRSNFCGKVFVLLVVLEKIKESLSIMRNYVLQLDLQWNK